MKESCYEIIVPQTGCDLRLDQFLGDQNLFKNRSQALKAVQAGKVFIKNRAVKPSYKLKPGDRLKILSVQGTEEKGIPSHSFPLNILYEDRDILVVNKPAGLVTHPAPGHRSDTLVNILYHKKKLSPGSGKFRPGIVHRLDKDVSGLLVLTKNELAEKHLIAQFKNRTVQRVYWGLSFRSPKTAEGKLESRLIRHPKDRKKFSSRPINEAKGRKAVTHYRILKQDENSGFALLEYILETGRTHQIRIHSATLHCPLLGDRVYGPGIGKNMRKGELKTLCKSLNRVALHAQSLGFIHPRYEKKLFFTSPWPEDLSPILTLLNFQDQ